MGILSSRQAPSQSADVVVPAHSYKYPPKSGVYFGSHFMMGGERFESTQPETYLFGDNGDLNFLGPKPVPFPYHQPASTEPIRTLQCLAALRRDSIKFAKASADNKRKAIEADDEEDGQSSETVASSEASPGEVHSHSAHIDLTSFEETQYNIEFVLDCDAPCSVTIYYFATEEVGSDGLRYTSKRPELTSPTYGYEIGASQMFSHPEHTFDPCLYRADELVHKDDAETIPVVIHCVADSPDTGCGPQSHSTLAIVEKSAEGHGFVLKPLKQKIYVDGVCYLLQEIYGIENKNLVPNAMGAGSPSASEREEGMFDYTNEESGTECVVCMSELRDTLILPCRHLCLCSACAETLRYKASACPICRAPFRALLQVKTLRRIRGGVGAVVSGHNVEQAVSESGVSTTAASFLNRYETVPLIEALNGPMEAPTVTLPINPIPAASPAAPAGQSVPSRGAGPSVKRAPKRPKGKRTRAPAAIQQVLTPQALVQPTPRSKESVVVSTDTEECSTSSSKFSPKSSAPSLKQQREQLCGQLLPGQTNEDEPANSDDEYLEAHSVACGEVVAKPELEGPTTDDENEITFDCGGDSQHAARNTQSEETNATEPVEPRQLGALPGTIKTGDKSAGEDTPNSSNSVSSVTSANSSHPLLPDSQKPTDAADV